MRKIASAFVLLVFSVAARAQTPSPSPPYVYAPTLTSSPAQVLSYNPSRKRLMFVNPSSTNTIAFCPPLTRSSGNPAVTCAVNGAGSITIVPLGSFTIDAGVPGGASLQMSSPWNGVASGSTGATILEFE